MFAVELMVNGQAGAAQVQRDGSDVYLARKREGGASLVPYRQMLPRASR